MPSQDIRTLLRSRSCSLRQNHWKSVSVYGKGSNAKVCTAKDSFNLDPFPPQSRRSHRQMRGTREPSQNQWLTFSWQDWWDCRKRMDSRQSPWYRWLQSPLRIVSSSFTLYSVWERRLTPPCICQSYTHDSFGYRWSGRLRSILSYHDLSCWHLIR